MKFSLTAFLIVALALTVAAGGVYVFRPFPETESPGARVAPVADEEEPVDNTEPWPPVTDSAGNKLPFTPVSEIVRVTLKTNQGDIGVVLDGGRAPLTVGNFVFLAENDFYDGTSFHRVIPDFMVQGGDPLSKDQSVRQQHGTGGPTYSFQDEINAASYGLDQRKLVDSVAPEQVAQLDEQAKQLSIQQFYELQGYKYTTKVDSLPLRRGVVAMANSGPNTNGSQFFIITAERVAHLEGKHTPFGVVESGMDVIDVISQVERDERDNPATAIVIEDVVVQRGGELPAGLETAE